MRYLAYNVRYSVIPVNSSLLTVTLYSSVITTVVYNDTIFSPFHGVITEFEWNSKCDILPSESNKSELRA
jgi:hypothetical protein